MENLHVLWYNSISKATKLRASKEERITREKYFGQEKTFRKDFPFFSFTLSLSLFSVVRCRRCCWGWTLFWWSEWYGKKCKAFSHICVYV
jgi:hypothetical protein